MPKNKGKVRLQNIQPLLVGMCHPRHLLYRCPITFFFRDELAILVEKGCGL